MSPPQIGPEGGYVTPFGKVHTVVMHLDKKYNNTLYHNKNVSVHERMVVLNERVNLKMYNKDKPIKSRIRIWVLAFSATDYICALEPYLAKATTDSMSRDI